MEFQLCRSKISESTCLVWFRPVLYIENLGVVIDLVTSPGFVEISEFWHNFLNGYRSYNSWEKLSICEEFVAMNTGLVPTLEFRENCPSVMWSSMRFAFGRPFVHRRPAWMFGLWLMDYPYGWTRDNNFCYPISCPLVQGSSKDINLHIYGLN